RLLLPNGEALDWDASQSLEIESFMALTYAQELVDRGELDRAKETLELVANRTTNLATDIRDLLDRIVGAVNEKAKAIKSAVPHREAASYAEANLAVLRQRFPAIAEKIRVASS